MKVISASCHNIIKTSDHDIVVAVIVLSGSQQVTFEEAVQAGDNSLLYLRHL
jgi:ribosome maturation protein Sdo1